MAAGTRRIGEPPTEFRDYEAVEKWLTNCPREWSVPIATRAALRVIPALAELKSRSRWRPSHALSAIVLPVFRCAAFAWFAGKHGSHGTAIRAGRAAYVAAQAARDANAYRAMYVSDIVTDAANAAVGAAAADAPTKATAFAAAKVITSSAVFEFAVEAAREDAVAIQQGDNLNDDISLHALWHGNIPDWALKDWSALCNALGQEDEEWSVWTEWYEDRLQGEAWAVARDRPVIEALELARITLPKIPGDPEEEEEGESVWHDAPAAVNRRIRKWEENYWPGWHAKQAREPPPKDFADRAAVSAWLGKQRRESSRLIAARAALRVFPLLKNLATHGGRPEDAKASVIIPLFRGTLVSWFAGTWERRNSSLLPSTASYAYSAVGRANTDTERAAAGAAAFAAGTAARSEPEVAADAASDALVNAAAAARAATDTARADGVALHNGESHFSVGVGPLWPQEIPDWATASWAELCGELRQGGDDWSVWTEWYEDRLHGEAWAAARGRPVIEALELARVTLPQIPDDPEEQEEGEAVWQQGPAAVNRRIRKWEERYWPEWHGKQPSSAIQPNEVEPSPVVVVGRGEVIGEGHGFAGKKRQSKSDAKVEKATAQREAAFGFEIRDGKIDAAPAPADAFDPALAATLHAEALAKALALKAKLAQTNSHAHVRATIDRLIETLGTESTAVNPGLLLSRSRSVEADRKAFDTEEARRELFPEAIAKMEDQLLSLQDLLAVYPSVRRIERERIALQIQRSKRAIERLDAPVREIEAIADEAAVVTEGAREALRSFDAAIEEEANIDALAGLAADRLLVIGNFTRRVARAGWDAAGPKLSAARKELGEFGIENWKQFKERFPQGFGDGSEAAGKALPVIVVAMLCVMIVGPWGGIAAAVPALKPLSNVLKSIWKKEKKEKKTKKKPTRAEGAKGAPDLKRRRNGKPDESEKREQPQRAKATRSKRNPKQS